MGVRSNLVRPITRFFALSSGRSNDAVASVASTRPSRYASSSVFAAAVPRARRRPPPPPPIVPSRAHHARAPSPPSPPLARAHAIRVHRATDPRAIVRAVAPRRRSRPGVAPTIRGPSRARSTAIVASDITRDDRARARCPRRHRSRFVDPSTRSRDDTDARAGPPGFRSVGRLARSGSRARSLGRALGPRHWWTTSRETSSTYG